MVTPGGHAHHLTGAARCAPSTCALFHTSPYVPGQIMPRSLRIPSRVFGAAAGEAGGAAACRYLEFLAAVTPALALAQEERAGVPMRRHDAASACRVMCRVAAMVYPGVGALRARLLGAASRRREGPVVAVAAFGECMHAAAATCDRVHGAIPPARAVVVLDHSACLWSHAPHGLSGGVLSPRDRR